jgi:hypothetical protein
MLIIYSIYARLIIICNAHYNNNKDERKLADVLFVYFILYDCIEFIHVPFSLSSNIAYSAKKPLLNLVWKFHLFINF